MNDQSDTSQDAQELPEGELEQRVLFSLLLPVVSLATLFKVSMKDLAGWLQIAHLKYLRDQGLTLKEAGDVLGVSERTAKRLFRQLKTSFLRPEIEHNLTVTLEFMLRAAPTSEARLTQMLRNVPSKTIAAALKQMLDENRIVQKSGRTVTYEVVQSVNSMVRDTWLARIGGLNSLMDNLADTLYGRFFRGDVRSFARTLTFNVMPERYDELMTAFTALVGTIAELDKEAEGNPDAVPVRLSLFFAPLGTAKPEKNALTPLDSGR